MSGVPQSGLTQQDPRSHLIDALRGQLGRWERSADAEDAPVFSCGTAAIDRLLPGGGLRHGMLVEWVGKKEQQSRRAGKQQSSRAAERPLADALLSPKPHPPPSSTTYHGAGRDARRLPGKPGARP